MQQRPLTTIGDPTASLSDIYFPSVTICNVNQVKRSVIERAGLTDQAEIKYLVSHFLTGENLTQPAQWNETLQKLKNKTSFDNTGDSQETSFGKIFSQVRMRASVVQMKRYFLI